MVLMFVISGIMKVRSFGSNESERFSKNSGSVYEKILKG
jgi:hypothetical protein